MVHVLLSLRCSSPLGTIPKLNEQVKLVMTVTICPQPSTFPSQSSTLGNDDALTSPGTTVFGSLGLRWQEVK